MISDIQWYIGITVYWIHDNKLNAAKVNTVILNEDFTVSVAVETGLVLHDFFTNEDKALEAFEQLIKKTNNDLQHIN